MSHLSRGGRAGLAWDRFLAPLAARRVNILPVVCFGSVLAYPLRVRGCPAEHVFGPKFVDGCMPVQPERLEWWAKVCRKWWENGVRPSSFIWRGPPRQPGEIVLRGLPRRLLPAIARHCEAVLESDRPEQAGYFEDSPYR